MGAQHLNAAKLLVEFLMSKEGADVYVEGEALYSFRAGYEPPADAKPYLMDLSKVKMLRLKDWVGAQELFKEERGAWQDVFR
jgi:ABC-type Fe3+ transport system substrate-binding protein